VALRTVEMRVDGRRKSKTNAQRRIELETARAGHPQRIGTWWPSSVRTNQRSRTAKRYPRHGAEFGRPSQLLDIDGGAFDVREEINLPRKAMATLRRYQGAQANTLSPGPVEDGTPCFSGAGHRVRTDDLKLGKLWRILNQCHTVSLNVLESSRIRLRQEWPKKSLYVTIDWQLVPAESTSTLTRAGLV
jgi:hypothetical protein